jgi:hypothetical protein
MRAWCDHNFFKMEELSNGIMVMCANCGERRELFKTGEIKITRANGQSSDFRGASTAGNL